MIQFCTCGSGCGEGDIRMASLQAVQVTAMQGKLNFVFLVIACVM